MTSFDNQASIATAVATVKGHIGLVTAVSLLVVYLLTRFSRSILSARSNLPPGPRGVPVLGVLHMLSPPFTDRPYMTVQDWWKRYGDVISFYMGSRLVVVVSGLEAMRECFIKNGAVFEGRPDSYLKRLTNGRGNDPH